jgi:hypothetical protein
MLISMKFTLQSITLVLSALSTWRKLPYVYIIVIIVINVFIIIMFIIITIW